MVLMKPGETLEEGEGQTHPPYERCDSLMVSEWGLEHTLKLREDNSARFSITPKINEEEQVSGDQTSPTKDEDLPLPSTPVLTSDPSRSKVDWWSKALDDGGAGVEDYDSLIEAMEKQKVSIIRVYVYMYMYTSTIIWILKGNTCC